MGAHAAGFTYIPGLKKGRLYDERYYEDDVLDAENVKRLQTLGYPLEDVAADGSVCMNAKEMARLWLFLLQKADPALKLTFAEDEEIPDLQFYGFDDKGRHVDFVGYGVFLDC